METFTFNVGRCWTIRAFGRNPLVRFSDRVEALVLVFVVVTALIAVPIAGAIGTAIYDSQARTYSAEARDRRPVTATVTENVTKSTEQTRLVVTAPVRWQVGGADHIDIVKVNPETKVADAVEIWVDGSGARVARPTPTSQAGIDALVAGTATWFAVMAGAAGLRGYLRVGLTRRRAESWDRELRTLVDDSGRTGNQA